MIIDKPQGKPTPTPPPRQMTQPDLVETTHYLFTAEHDLLRESVRGWAQRRVTPHIEEWERAGDLPDSIFVELGDQGFLGLQYPEEYGGQGGDFAANIVLCEELSHIGAESLGTAVAVHTAMATPPILRFGTAEQKERLLPDLLAGRKLAALALTEPAGGSDVANMKTVARRQPGGWTLDGAKTFITNGCRAGVLLVLARTPEGDVAARKSFTAFVIDPALPGVSRGPRLEKLGRHASDTCELFFDGVLLPENALLGEEGLGFQHIKWELEAERIMSAATSVALGEHTLDLALEYIRGRRQFGQPIANFQAVRHELASKAARLRAAREFVHATAWRFQNERAEPADSSMAKLVASDALFEVADYALQLHGGYGYMQEYPIGRLWIDARVKRITAGTDEIQREIIARHVVGRLERKAN
jgi:alkylation response protein AidB-like acyl-CoA dehydrogenase